MRFGKTSATEIDSKLRDDFRRRVKDFGISAEVTDPVLAVLFRTFAQQLESLYSETDRIRLALLDELIANLGFEPRMARAAQTVVRFLLDHGSQLMAAGTELVGEAQTGERLTFMTDATLCVSDARLAVALCYQDGSLRVLSSVEMPEALQLLRPSLEAVRVNLGPNPALFLAVENLPAEHLSQHTFFFELGPDAMRVQQALQHETWCLMNCSGELVANGILRVHGVNGGVRALEWLVPPVAGAKAAQDAEEEVATLPPGFYGPRTFLFPVVPSERRFLCKVPRAMEGAIGKLFGREWQKNFSSERAWLRISMPCDVSALHTAIGGISLHAITASNVECFNQTIVFEKQGTSIPITREEGGAANYLVGPLSILSESGDPYLSQTELSTRPGAGRYSIRNGRMELIPALRPDGRAETYANLRLWVTNGSLANSVGPGQVTAFLKPSQISGLRLANPASATGGTDGEELTNAQNRFAEALLGRQRIVTQADLFNAVRAFDNRIKSAMIEPHVQRSGQGLQRVERILIGLNPDDFIDPNTEFPLLQEGLLRFLAHRFPLGTEVAVELLA